MPGYVDPDNPMMLGAIIKDLHANERRHKSKKTQGAQAKVDFVNEGLQEIEADDSKCNTVHLSIFLLKFNLCNYFFCTLDVTLNI